MANLLQIALGSFETRPCGRCGGSGTHSRCEMWGTTCFQCGFQPHVPGTGRQLTKRGAVAKEFFLAQMPRKAARDLQPGDVFFPYEGRGERAMVREVRPMDGELIPQNAGLLDVYAKGIIYGGIRPETLYRVAPSPEQIEVARVAALAYQETLTKAGTVRKRAAK